MFRLLTVSCGSGVANAARREIIMCKTCFSGAALALAFNWHHHSWIILSKSPLVFDRIIFSITGSEEKRINSSSYLKAQQNYSYSFYQNWDFVNSLIDFNH
jgi:hypothetical protein